MSERKGWVPDFIWKNVFWFVRTAAAAARIGWDSAGQMVGGRIPTIGGR